MNWREHLDGFPVIFTIPVQWGEQDSFGHVNNTNYFRWCETARIVYLERIGFSSIDAETGLGPIVAHIGCNFRKPVEYPDTLHIGARVSRLGNSSFKMDHVVVSESLGLVADADSTLVVLNYKTSRPESIPAHIRAAIEKIEAKSTT